MGEVFENWAVNILGAWFSGLRILFGKVWKAPQYTIRVYVSLFLQTNKQTKKNSNKKKQTKKQYVLMLIRENHVKHFLPI